MILRATAAAVRFRPSDASHRRAAPHRRAGRRARRRGAAAEEAGHAGRGRETGTEARDETRQQRSDGAEAPASPMWRPVSRANTYERVIDAVEEQIMAGSLTVGDPLPAERDLADKLGVSRASVREALRVLDSLGVVRSAGGSGRGAGTFIAAMPSAALTRFL